MNESIFKKSLKICSIILSILGIIILCSIAVTLYFAIRNSRLHIIIISLFFMGVSALLFQTAYEINFDLSSRTIYKFSGTISLIVYLITIHLYKSLMPVGSNFIIILFFGMVPYAIAILAYIFLKGYLIREAIRFKLIRHSTAADSVPSPQS